MFSINRSAYNYNTVAEGDLHSTMFSINPGFRRASQTHRGIYIPLCFLLIRTAAGRS